MVSKKIISILLILTICISALCACGKDDSIISSELIKIEENDMVSSELVIGELKKTVTKEAGAFYPITAQLTPNTGGVIMVDVKVSNLDYVKKGDLLAELRPYSDEEIKEKEEVIKEKENDLNTMMNYYDNELAELNSLLSASSGAQREIYQLKIEENELNRNYTYTTTSAEISKLKEELELMKADKGDCNIYAPFDGVIDSVQIAQEGTVLTENSVVFTMHSIDTVILYFDDPGYVYCDNVVKVTAGTGENKQEIEGKVVCADYYLHSNIHSGKVYVRLQGEYDKENLNNIEVELTTYNVSNVLTTRLSGIVSDKDKDYVYILENGELKRRHVIVGGNDDVNAWILQGVEEGDIVYLQ